MISERSDGTEPAVELSREPSGAARGAGPTRRDLPRRRGSRPGPDPTRQDLPARPRGRAAEARGAATDTAEGANGDRGIADGPGAGGDGDRTAVLERRGARYGTGAETPRAGARPRRRRWAWRAIALVLLTAVAIPLLTAFRVWYVAREDDRRHSDAIIVLGAAQYNGRPSPVLEWRLLHALKLYREGVAPHIVTVGGNRPGDHYTEAGTGKAWLHEHGVPDDRLVAVRSGSDTLQSMIDVGLEYRRLGWHTGVIVTDPPHALRSRTMARDNGIDAVTSPTRSGPTVGSRDTEFNYIVRETGGYLYYELIGRWHPGA